MCHTQILGKSYRNLRDRELEEQLLYYLCEGSLEMVVKRFGYCAGSLLSA